MPRGILYVETRPRSPEQEAEYHKWYNEIHVREIVGLDGFVSARRFEPVGHEGPFIAIYEIDADDIEATRDRLTDAYRSGRASLPGLLELDPPPTARYYRETLTYTP